MHTNIKKSFFNLTTEANSSDLARYVCHRKAIIEFLRQKLAKQENGKYSLENQIHSIIFPLGKTSNDINFNVLGKNVKNTSIKYIGPLNKT